MAEGQSGDDRRFKTVQNQISGWLMQNQPPLLSANLKEDRRFSRIAYGDRSIKSGIGVPLRVEGALILLNKTISVFSATSSSAELPPAYPEGYNEQQFIGYRKEGA